MFVWVLGKFGFNLSRLLGDAVEASRGGKKVLDPGLQYGKSGLTKIDFISLSLALVLGTAGLPHVLMRFYTVPIVQGGPEVGRVGHLADRHLLPVHPRPRLRRRRPRRPEGHRRGTRQGQLGRAAAGLRARRRAAARPHLGGRVRDDPRGRRRPDDHRQRQPVARHLQLRHQGGHRHAGGGGQGRPHHRGRHRHLRHPRRHPRQRAEHRVPRRPRLRRRGVARTCRRSSTRCSGSGSTPAVRCGRSTAVSITALTLIVFSPVVSGKRGRPGRPASAVDVRRASTSTGSRWTTRASSRSRWPSCSAGSAP